MDTPFTRAFENELVKSARPGTVISLFGARRTGKTTLMKAVMSHFKTSETLMVQGDDLDVSEILSNHRISVLSSFLKGYKYLFIDEAQEIPNIGKSLKLIVDKMPDISIFITGSSAIDLRDKVGEPLTGRGHHYYLYPFSQMELGEDFLTSKETLEQKLIYGLYPQVYTAETVKDKIAHLTSIKDGYLLKDILMLANQKDTLFILNLLRLLAFQIGNDISYNALASRLNSNKKTVMRYLQLLEKTFVIFPLHGFSRNLRSEFSQTPRYFFWDNGIRNVLVSNFNSLNARDDIGRLWENYCISQRMIRNHYHGETVNAYFWRTYTQKEIDMVEEKGGRLYGYEMKWNEKRKVKPPKKFLETYTNSEFAVIDRLNHLDFIS